MSTFRLSPVTEMQDKLNGANFLCQSTTRSSHSALVGETVSEVNRNLVERLLSHSGLEINNS